MPHVLHQMQDSGNCFKVRLAAAHLGVPLALRDVDVVGGEAQTEAFRAVNPAGKVPALAIEGGPVLAESNAILCWLADGTALLPDDRLHRAQVLAWLFWEQYSHEPYIATVRYWLHVLGDADSHAAAIAERRPKGEAALALMDRHLATSDWFGPAGFSIADIALYAYTHVAHQGGFDVDGLVHLTGWLERVRCLPNHIDINARP